MQSTQKEVAYLTNACGESTGHGTIELTEDQLNVIPFEQGPGTLLLYVVEIDEKAYALANLEVAYQDAFWEDNKFMPENEAMDYCLRANAFLENRLSNDALVLPIDESSPGRLIVGLAIPLENLKNADQTMKTFFAIFDDLAYQNSHFDQLAKIDRPLHN